MDEQAPKKRRLNSPTALHKPFKSPFRAAAGIASISSSPPRPITRDCTNSTSNVSQPASSPITSRTQPTSSPLAPRSNNLNHLRQPRRALAPEISAAQREYTTLINHVRTLRSALDTLKQAAKIEDGDQDAELERLIGVWRGVSQRAAEEIFATVKDKVNKMGGVVAWRKKEQERKERLEEWAKEGQEDEESEDDDNEEDEDKDEGEGEAADSEEKARRREQREMMRDAKEATKEQRRIARAEMAEMQEEKVVKAAPDVFPEDETFTMDMMLKEMKVDLDIIGFDAGAQKWVMD